MRNRGELTARVLVVVAVVLLASTNVSGEPVLSGTVTGGTFINPNGAASCTALTAPVQCSGDGTGTFSWGDNASTLTFTAIPFPDTPRFQDFKIGKLDFHNSTNTDGTEVSRIDLTFSSGNVASTDPAFDSIYDNIVFVLELHISNTPNTGTPQQNADDITVVSVRENGQPSSVKFDPNVFSVIETTALVNGETFVYIEAQFHSLDLVGYGQVGDPSVGFVSSSVIPQPSTVALVGGGVIVLVLARLRRNRGSAGWVLLE